MGNVFANLFDYFFGKEDVRILMVGLDAAGKTTILYQLKLGEVITTIPTIGFNVDTLEYKNIRFTVWDVGGQKRIRAMWRYYYQNTSALIYVVDSTDVYRIDEAKEELMAVLTDDEMQNCIVLVFANKQDMPNAINATEMANRLGLHDIKQTWHIQGACAINGQGIYDGLEMLRLMLRERKRKTSSSGF